METKMKKFHSLLGLGLLTLGNSASADLIFSEYIEGSSLNKAVELYNVSESSVDLSDYTINLFSNGNSSANSSFNLSGTLESGEVFVVANPGASSAILNVADATSGTINFNGDDALTLTGIDNVLVDSIGQVGFDPGSQWGSGDTSTQNNTIRRKLSVTSGDTNSSDAFDPSIEWDGFPQDTFAGLGSYDGNGGGGPVYVEVTIPEIQGAAHISPLDGETVLTTGIVTAVDSNGFYMQDVEGDGNPDTSDGILVFTSSTPTVAVGDMVEVAGNVTEYIPGGASTNNLSMTEIVSPQIAVLSVENVLPAPVIIGAAGRQAPVTVVDNDNFAVFDPAEDGIDFYESLEGMLVTVADAKAVSPTNRFNETFVLADQGANATGNNARGGITVAETDYNPERIQLQTDSTLLPDFSLQADVADLLGDVTGVVGYSFGNFEVLMTQAPQLVSGGLAPETTSLAGDEDHVTIASYNVQNLDPVIENIGLVGSSRDIDDDIGDGKFDAIANHLVNSLNSPDIVALQEMQDSDGAQQTGTVDADVTAATLISAITAAGGPAYEYADLPPVDGADGGQPGGNIRVGYLYNPARVSFDANSMQRIGEGEAAFDATRKSLYASFTFNDETIHVINNHLSSKGGSSPIFGQIQPFINGRVDNRDAQAALVNDFVDGLLLVDNAAKVVVLGDMNEFYFEQPLLTLKGDEPVLVNLLESDPNEEIYSYIFQGNSQALDHVLVSNALENKSEHDVVHLNAEFSSQASDHDPAVLRLNLASPVVEVPTIDAVREYFYSEVVAGNIEGTGNRFWAKRARVSNFYWRLLRIERAIDRGRTQAACRRIDRAIALSDGANFDLIEGESVPSLNQMLVELQNEVCGIEEEPVEIILQ